MRRIKLLLAVAAAMTMLMVMSVPAMADDFGRACFLFCNDHHDDFDHHNLFIDDFDDFDDFYDLDDDFDDFFDDCEFIGFDGDEAIYVCELDF